MTKGRNKTIAIAAAQIAMQAQLLTGLAKSEGRCARVKRLSLYVAKDCSAQLMFYEKLPTTC